MKEDCPGLYMCLFYLSGLELQTNVYQYQLTMTNIDQNKLTSLYVIVRKS